MNWLKHGIASKRIIRILLVLVGLGLAALGAVNAFDYFQFQRAWNIGDRLSADDFSQVAAACSEIEKAGGPQRFREDLIPSAFQRLRPLSATFYPGSSDLPLYRLGDAYVILRIDTSREDQHIFLYAIVGGRQQQKTLWRNDPTLAQRTSPTGRLLTISELGTRPARKWIVLPNEIRVITQRTTVGSRDAIAATVALSPSQRQAILAAIRAIPLSMLGRKHTSAGVDGIQLVLSFTADGQHGPSDIELSNTWREAMTPLVDSVSQCLPAEHRIHFRENILQNPSYNTEHDSVWTWPEVDARERSWMKLPWWCLWQRFEAWR